MVVEPVLNERAATATVDGQRLLIVADYHAGIESVLQSDGVEIRSQADSRRERLLGLIAETGADRLVVLGDLVHAIGTPWETEREELRKLFDALTVPMTLVKGNHDGEIEAFLDELDHDITVTPSGGTRIGPVGFVHGHTWPAVDLFEAAVICVGHEHPVVRLEDSVGGSRIEHVWLRGDVVLSGFQDHYDEPLAGECSLVVFPAFNELSGGTWINVEGREFLSPFLPDGLGNGRAYLLDGTRLGAYETV
jgi:putative SbcD/Mre11-related phosphoesterase